MYGGHYVYSIYFDFEVVIASLFGDQLKHLERKNKPVAFFILFTMGIIAAGVKLDVINDLVTLACTDQRALVALVCIALIIMACINITSKVNNLLGKNKKLAVQYGSFEFNNIKVRK